jgi:hypothetical protein
MSTTNRPAAAARGDLVEVLRTVTVGTWSKSETKQVWVSGPVVDIIHDGLVGDIVVVANDEWPGGRCSGVVRYGHVRTAVSP